MLIVEENERRSIVARCSEESPLEVAPRFVRVGSQDLVDCKPFGALIGVAEQQPALIPRIDQWRFAFGNGDRTSIRAFHRGVASHVVRMAVGVDEF